MSQPTVYSMGMAFSEGLDRVLLIEKNRPDFLRGKWTGVGGHVEPGETPLAAVVREVEEETGLSVAPERWREAGSFTDGATYVIHLFACRASIDGARSTTEEQVGVHAVADLDALAQGPRLTEYLEAARNALEAFEHSPYATERRSRRGFQPG